VDIYDPDTNEFLGVYDPSVIESHYDVHYGERREVRAFTDRELLGKYLGQCQKDGKRVNVEYRHDTWQGAVHYLVETTWREARMVPPTISWKAEAVEEKLSPPPPKTNRQWLNEQIESVCRLARVA
jgi:hypothetical protein